jgi:hypothetical protein
MVVAPAKPNPGQELLQQCGSFRFPSSPEHQEGGGAAAASAPLPLFPQQRELRGAAHQRRAAALLSPGGGGRPGARGADALREQQGLGAGPAPPARRSVKRAR